MPAKNIEDDLYVNLRKPLELRRGLLEASKDVLYTLQRVEKIINLRKEKTELIAKLKVQIGEINILTTKLAEHLPDYTFTIKQKKELKDLMITHGHDGKKHHKKSSSKKKKSKSGKKGKKTKSAPSKKKSQEKSPITKKVVKSRKSISDQLNKVQSRLSRLKK